MKTLTCAQMGGPCETEVSAASWDAMKAEGMKHLQEAHPEMVSKMKDMSPEDNAKWETEAKAKFDAAPEVQ